ncbi:MAG TPA: SRPBCC family protein [Thermoanaerobaculia bacterium]|nr:SRPBCC family protein [Thermoanaerobaculia bacterium]
MTLPPYDFDSRLASARTLPSTYYFDPAILEIEQKTVFAHSWQLVGRRDQLLSPGSYFTTTVGHEPLLIVHGQDGMIRALSNVCRHRAGPVAQGAGTRARFRCGYHGWTYSNDGCLLQAPEFEGVENFEPDNVRLPEFQLEIWNDLVFVNLSAKGPTLMEALGELPSRINGSFGGYRLAARKEWDLECNWKVYVDNYLEGYHIPIVHPSLMRELDYANYKTETGRYFSIQHSPIRNPDRLRTADGASSEAQYFWLFPNLMLNVYPDNFSTNLIVPLSAERTRTVFEWFFADGSGNGSEVDETVAFSDEIQIEDIEICEAVQRGLRSPTYSTGRYSVARENGVHHFHGLLSEFFGKHGAA